MSKINLAVSGVVTGGVIEADQAYQAKWDVRINSNPLPSRGVVNVYDASSPVPNLRPEEIFMALVALNSTRGSSVIVRTDLGCGATFAEYGSLWGLKPQINPNWLKFYESISIMGRIDPAFAPISKGIHAAISKRKQLILDLWALLAPHLNADVSEAVNRFRLDIFEVDFAEVKVATLVNAVNEGGVMLSFACPLCSYQEKKPVYHAIRRNRNGITITKSDRSSAECRCKGAIAWIKSWDNLTVWEACYYLGAKMYGKCTYYLAGNLRPQPAIFVRDYSEPRGTVAMIVKAWKRQLWLSTRVYVNTSSDVSFQASVTANPKSWASLIKTFPLFGDGKRYDVTY